MPVTICRSCLAAYEVLSDEAGRTGVVHTGFAMTALPHKRITQPVWERDGGQVKLLVESGLDSGSTDAASHTGRRLCQIRSTQEPMSMERTEVLDMMGTLKLFGMKTAYDETLATAIKRKHEPQRFVGDLLKAEISEKQGFIRYQMAIAKLPLAKDIDDSAFKGTPINEGLVRDIAGGNFIAQQRNVVLVGGTGTGKTHLPIAIARSCIRTGSRGRFFTTIDLVNRLEAEGRASRQGWLADFLTRDADLASVVMKIGRSA